VKKEAEAVLEKNVHAAFQPLNLRDRRYVRNPAERPVSYVLIVVWYFRACCPSKTSKIPTELVISSYPVGISALAVPQKRQKYRLNWSFRVILSVFQRSPSLENDKNTDKTGHFE
jgi:hypothetical protein